MANDALNDKVKSAKAALSHANASFPSPTPAAAATAKGASAMPTPPAPPAPKDNSIGGGLNWKAQQVRQNQDVIGQFKDGGKVPKTGNYKLHKGETVLTADEGKTVAKKNDKQEGMADLAGLGAKKRTKKVRMNIESSDNDGFITRHSTEGDEKEPSRREETHVHPDMKALMEHVKGVYGGSTDGEPTADTEAQEETPAGGKPSV